MRWKGTLQTVGVHCDGCLWPRKPLAEELLINKHHFSATKMYFDLCQNGHR
jgi:hypothetical protein